MCFFVIHFFLSSASITHSVSDTFSPNMNIISSTLLTPLWMRGEAFFISRLSSFISSYRYDLCLRELRIRFLSEYLNFSELREVYRVSGRTQGETSDDIFSKNLSLFEETRKSPEMQKRRRLFKTLIFTSGKSSSSGPLFTDSSSGLRECFCMCTLENNIQNISLSSIRH